MELVRYFSDLIHARGNISSINNSRTGQDNGLEPTAVHSAPVHYLRMQIADTGK